MKTFNEIKNELTVWAELNPQVANGIKVAIGISIMLLMIVVFTWKPKPKIQEQKIDYSAFATQLMVQGDSSTIDSETLEMWVHGVLRQNIYDYKVENHKIIKK